MHVLVGIPSYGSDNVAAKPLLLALNRKHKFAYRPEQGSLLAYNHNRLLVLGLNLRSEGVTHLLIMHSDVEPDQEDWFDVMCGTMTESGADILSAVIPIKDATGITSTALDIGESKWKPYRLSLRDVSGLPTTFTTDALLLNTGLMMIALDRPWLERGVREGTVKFHIDDDIAVDSEGRFAARVASEDWNFSRFAKACGAKLYATSAIRLMHYGNVSFASNQVWGEGDPLHKSLNKEILFTAPNGEMKAVRI